jgi:hypothetical protein
VRPLSAEAAASSTRSDRPTAARTSSALCAAGICASSMCGPASDSYADSTSLIFFERYVAEIWEVVKRSGLSRLYIYILVYIYFYINILLK